MKGAVLDTVVTIETILTDVGKFVTAGVGWMGDVAEYVMSEPFVLLMCCIIPLSGWAIGALRRLTRL